MATTDKFVLFGCWTDPDKKYDESGYVAFEVTSNRLYLTDIVENAKIYDGSVPNGKGSPRDWALMINEDYGLNVHPVKLVTKVS